jgi:hypothetical protein
MRSLHRIRDKDSSRGAPKRVMKGFMAVSAVCMGAQQSERMLRDFHRER